MISNTVRRTAGILFITVPIVFTVCFTLLQQLFEYPDILLNGKDGNRNAQ